MKMFAILRKDLTQSFRSFFALFFMFAVPMLTTVLFYVIFGGFGGDDEAFDLPRTRTVIVNLDQGEVFSGDAELDTAELPQNFAVDFTGVGSMGDLMTSILLSESFSDLLIVTLETDIDVARTLVDQQEAGVAVIIPADFSAALTEPGATAAVEFYQDPTLILGPAIVKSIVSSLLDSFMTNKITVAVAVEQLAEAGGTINATVIQDIIAQSSAGASQGLAGSGSTDQASLVVVQELNEGREVSMLASMLGVILSGMAVFYLFFTGAATSQSILTEEEKGTLPRLFTTPTPISAILNGKTLAVFVILIVQISVLLLFGRYVFNIYWGEPLEVTVVAVSVVFLAGTAGHFIISWLTNTRQAGMVFGGVLTITGMLGMVTVFAGGVNQVPAAVATASLLVPQGWAVRAFDIAMQGGTLLDLLPILAGIFAWALVFGIIGQYRLKRRYA